MKGNEDFKPTDSEVKKNEKKLKGKELADYVEGNKDSFEGNGDALCVGAGYGDFSEDGTPRCNFQPFVKELGKAMDLVEKKDTPEDQ